MKILHVINDLDMGGAQKLLAYLLPELSRQHTVELVVLSNREGCFERQLERSRVKITHLGCSNPKSPRSFFLLKNIIKGFDVVHAHLFPTLYWVGLAAKSLKKRPKLFYTEHSTDNKRRHHSVFRPVEKRIYSIYDNIICISEPTQTNLDRWLDSSHPGLATIHNGVNLDKFRNADMKLPDRKIVIMVSRFSPSKDQETLIRAMAHVSHATELWLAGDGETAEQAKALARSLGLEERVKFLGNRMDIPELLHQSYVGVQSSKWEGFGLTAVEMMAAGVPVIGTRVPGLADVIGDCGLLFEQGDAKDLARKIDLLCSDEKLHESFRSKGLRRCEDFSIEKMANKYLELYSSLGNDRR